ncbi:MAG: alpha/beta hydrolase, partial [Halobacteria archaeon]|nr:alpha/beta hydrolase [Halobacteria archaeon]
RVLPVENAEMLHERLPNSELELVEGASHLFFIENPEVVNRRILEFLGDG